VYTKLTIWEISDNLEVVHMLSCMSFIYIWSVKLTTHLCLCWGQECVEVYLHSHFMPSWHGAQFKHQDNFNPPRCGWWLYLFDFNAE